MIFFFEKVLGYLFSIRLLGWRLGSYAEKLYYETKFEWILSINLIDNPFAKSTASIILNSLRYRLINTLSFFLILSYYSWKLLQVNSKDVFFHYPFLSKVSLLFSPLILFYINVIFSKAETTRLTRTETRDISVLVEKKMI